MGVVGITPIWQQTVGVTVTVGVAVTVGVTVGTASLKCQADQIRVCHAVHSLTYFYCQVAVRLL